jgi:glutathione S-transferase
MVVLHHLEQSRSQRVLWLLEELDVGYELRRYERDAASGLAPESLRKIHPLGKSPVVTEGKRTVAESAVIVEYLCREHGGTDWLRQPGDADYYDFQFWMHYAEASVMPPLLLKLVFSRVREAPMPFFVRPIARGIADKVDKSFTDPQIDAHFSHVEAQLTGQDWLLGERISAADIMMSFPLEAALASGRVGPGFPRIRDYVLRLQARPAYQRALEVGGDYDYVVEAD